MKSIILIFLTASAIAQCGVERNDVKDLKDAAAKEIHFDAKSMTIASLRKIKPPAKIGNTLPRQDGEKQVYEVEAQVIGFKYEKDGDRDYHVVLSTIGKPAETMIIEIPHPDCGPLIYKTIFTELRSFINSLAPNHTPGPTFYELPKPVPVKASGVVFFDKIHGTHVNLDGTEGQIGVAPNGIELHPVLALKRAK
jgi:hypothetical protein